MPRTAYQIGLTVFALWTSCGPVTALEASDKLASWNSASPTEKARLVTELLKRDGLEKGTLGIVNCLDAASGIPGHADLSIGRVVKACEQNQGEPV